MDIEASGLGSSSYPIEIGLVLPNNDKYCSLIHPCQDWHHWDQQAERTHGISRELLTKQGRHPRDIALELNSLLDNLTLYSDGWVVDSTWLKQLYYAAGITPSFRLSPIETILSEKQMNSWHKTKQLVTSELNLKRHRASNDAIIIQETFARTRNNERHIQLS
ncbi:hypothetical protein C2869_13890 [Saccharobesus litoralis]|uniref:Exonuclease domain-containing protein n=2 Tax=Saccharobesus litoralis TaxID=2172099 RepID=A0A2S0VXX8_9ALTE|nr:hypothetical protein C2869_13890 [Saccharobesus litoralis]